jgi:neutral ceramidase
VATWAPVAYDYDTSTRYIWQRDGVSFSKVKIEWHIPADAASGDYRIRHIGQWKSGWTGAISRYEGTSNTFAVSN